MFVRLRSRTIQWRFIFDIFVQTSMQRYKCTDTHTRSQSV